ncbi:MAG: hypothetical protein WA705_10195 [Candidatus Ozemobacteraceae bacterium]
MSLTDSQRFPLLNDEGRQMLDRLREHPHAPVFNHPCGDCLTQAGFQAVRAYETALNEAPREGAEGGVAPWVLELVERCRRDVPFYRRLYEGVSTREITSDVFFRLPCCDRRDLKREPEAFVSDGVPLDEMIVYWTTGTTGQALDIYSHPVVASIYLAALRYALGLAGIALEGGSKRVSIVNVSDQEMTFTYATVMSYLRQAGHVKVNLNVRDWKCPEDRAAFLDDCVPEVYTGDPVAFAALARLPLKTRPKALVSSAMALLPAWKRALEKHFGCPVLDVYSMNESRFLAVASADYSVRSGSTKGGITHGDSRQDEVSHHEVLPHDVFVEIVDADGNPLPAGMRGEIAITSGRNPYMSLIRYRTGDYAALQCSVSNGGTRLVLVGLEGRTPTLFRGIDGRIINSIDVTHRLGNFAFPQFSLRQKADGALVFGARGESFDRELVRKALSDLFGDAQTLSIGELSERETISGKIISYVQEGADLLRMEPGNGGK